MSETEKLQKAVELTIAAGYQLNKDAFEFLKSITSTEDPTEIISKALKKANALKEKPLFIEKSFLENLIKEEALTNEKLSPPLIEEHVEVLQEPRLTEAKRLYRPLAKEFEPNINILEDPTEKLSSNGTLEDYLEYFRDRFKRMEKLLRQRIDVRGASSIIDALKAPANTKLKIICMVTEKRELQQKMLLTVEDLKASVTVLVPQNAKKEVLEKARSVLPDQVVCLDVRKTRSNLLITEDIILPDVASKAPSKAPLPVYAALTSDMHVGSAKFQREAFNRFILWLNGKYGDERLRDIASHVKYVIIAGDIVDGIGVYPNQLKELTIKDIYGQYEKAAQFIEQIPDYIEVVIIPGNHDAPRKALPQPAISDTFLEALQASRKVYSLGNPCRISIHNVELLLYHGRSLDDITSTVPGVDINHPEKAMTLLLQSRHLAPMYGAKTPLAPENRDFLVIEHVPDIFHAGHVHILGYTNYRGVLVVNSGGWQEQTDYMRRMGVTPTPGKVPVVNLQTLEVNVIPFS
ncbi:MAG: DNA-directed DNA polymerase II small subunit [Candidatus Bathyarchaeia archaeon]